MNGWKADVLIDARLLAYRRGGIARYVGEIATWMPRVAPDLDIVPFVNRPQNHDSRRWARVFTPPHHRLERLTLGPELSIRFPRLIHSPDFIAPASIGPRRVVTIHDLTFLSHPDYLARQSRRYYGRLLGSLEVADRVIAVSRYTADELLRQTGVESSKVVTILNGVDRTAVAPSVAEARQIIVSKIDPTLSSSLLCERPIILSVGTVEPRKRHEILLRAMKSPGLTRTIPKPILLVAGQRGWACEEIVRMIERGTGGGDVIWLKSVDDDLLAALYRVSSVVAMPSLDEGFGLPMLEAMLAETPVIAAAKGALPEVAGDAAVLISGDDPDEWGVAIANLLDDPELQTALRRKGLKRAAELTWEETARKTADVYREVLAQ